MNIALYFLQVIRNRLFTDTAGRIRGKDYIMRLRSDLRALIRSVDDAGDDSFTVTNQHVTGFGSLRFAAQ